jgi:hypothetical protein
MNAKLISIIAPFHNEAGGVNGFHEALSSALQGVPGYQFEIICVDDGSSDGTLAELVRLVERDPRVRVLELSRNFGKEAALTAGIDASRGDAVISMDVDPAGALTSVPAVARTRFPSRKAASTSYACSTCRSTSTKTSRRCRRSAPCSPPAGEP